MFTLNLFRQIKDFFRKIRSWIDDPNVRFLYIALMVTITISTVFFAINISDKTYHYSIGDIALEDISVPKDIHYRNEPETRMIEKRAADTVPPVFDKDKSVLQEKLKIIGILFNNVINTLRENPPIGTEDLTFQLMALKSQRLPRYLHYSDKILTELLRYRDPVQLKKTTYRIMIYIYDSREMGIVDKSIRELDIVNNNIAIRTINSPDVDLEYSSTLNNLRTMDELKDRLYGICKSIAPNLPQSTLNALTVIVRSNLKANINYNQEETRRRIFEKVSTVKPVMEVLKKGQNIVREGDTITSEIIEKIEILNRNAQSSNLSYISGVFLLQLFFLFIIGYFLVEYNRLLVLDKRSSMILFTLMFFFMVYAFIIARADFFTSSNLEFALLLPIPFMTMMVAILYNMYLAMLMGINVIFFTFLIGGGDLSTLIIAFSSSFMGVLVAGDVERRSDFLRGGFIMGVANAVIVAAVALMQEIPLKQASYNMQLSLASGIMNSILLLGIIPLYENVFGITTRFKLLELSDLNADIFKKMLVEAPGTYNHSLLVSTMAETACKDIHANYMLARVGAYYHDIGKITDAGLYIENKITDSRAGRLSPQEYSQLIISHVKKGVDIAKRNGLPEKVIDFIREHHGKSTMAFFYHQALEAADQADNLEEVNRSDFQYPGPKPHSKETGIVMLADAIEAASRSIKDPTHAKLDGLVTKIIYNKLNEGDLDNTDLSMAELNVVRKSFLRILNGIFHTRIEYPETGDLKKLEKKSGKGNNGKD